MKKFAYVLIFILLTGIRLCAEAEIVEFDNSLYRMNQVSAVDGSFTVRKKRGLKKGISQSKDILGLVTTGNSGVQQACENGGISQIHSIDRKTEGLWFFYRKYITIIYGE